MSLKKEKNSLSRDFNKERWTDERTKKFVTMYRNLPVLWDVSNELYNQRSKKTEAFNQLQKEFDLTLNEVRNKIRIYRTTYAQELRKMTINSDYQPKLAWFHTLHEAFSQGTIKSFVKTPKQEKNSKQPYNIQIEYAEEEFDDSVTEENETQYEIKRIDEKNNSGTLILSPYEEHEYEMMEGSQVEIATNQTINSPTELQQSTPKTSTATLSSNELFLNSLLSTLDRLPEDKNMRARIKIQEILYKITYDND